MTAEMQAIKVAYEEEGLSVEDISNLRKLDSAAIKSCLMQVSSRYRKDCGKEDEVEDSLNFSKDEQQRVKDAILDLALSTDDPHLKFKALVYCRDDAKGRKDIVKNQQNGSTFNILQINERMKSMRLLADRAKGIVEIGQ